MITIHCHLLILRNICVLIYSIAHLLIFLNYDEPIMKKISPIATTSPIIISLQRRGGGLVAGMSCLWCGTSEALIMVVGDCCVRWSSVSSSPSSSLSRLASFCARSKSYCDNNVVFFLPRTTSSHNLQR